MGLLTICVCYVLIFLLCVGVIFFIREVFGFSLSTAMMSAVFLSIPICIWLVISKSNKNRRLVEGLPVSIEEYYHEEARLMDGPRRKPLEVETAVLNAEVFFGHDADIGATTRESIPGFLQSAVTAHHWCLFFDFYVTKRIICELWVTESERIMGVYRPLTPDDEAKYGRNWMRVSEANI